MEFVMKVEMSRNTKITAKLNNFLRYLTFQDMRKENYYKILFVKKSINLLLCLNHEYI